MNATVASKVVFPSVTPTTEYGRASTRLAGTGTTESSSLQFPVGSMATILVGAGSIRFVLAEDRGLANTVATTDMLLPAGSLVTWTVDKLTRVIYVEAGDGVAAYEAWVWRSS